MEKYSKWRDASTGIHPFLPKAGRSEDEGGIYYVKLIFGSILSLVRLPVVFSLLFIIFLSNIIAKMLFISPIRRAFERLIDTTVTRTILFFLGFYWIPTKFMKPFHPKSPLPTTTPGSYIKAGDIIIANHCSYVEILYLAFRFSPAFTSIPINWKGYPKDVPFIVRNTFQAIMNVFGEPKDTQGTMKLSEVIKYATSIGAPVVIFPEGGTTNGRALIQCLPVLGESASSIPISKINVLGFKYEYENFSPSFTVGNSFIHLFKLCKEFQNNLEVRYLSPKDLALQIEEKGVENTEETVFSALSTILRSNQTKLTIQDKQEFKSYWYGHKKNY